MASDDLSVRLREDTGSRASRRLRRAGEFPAVLGGLGQDVVNLAVPTQEFEKARRDGAQLLTLGLGDDQVEVLVRDIQYDAFGEKILHVDFDRVKRGELISLEIPIEFFGEPEGGSEAGIFQTRMTSLNVECLPRSIPEKIEVDIRGLTLGDEVRTADLTLPEGVSLVDVSGEEVIAVFAALTVEEEVEEVEEAADQPEILSEKQTDEEGKEKAD